MLNKSSEKVLEVLAAFSGERLSDREIMELAEIRSQQTLTRAKKELNNKGYVKYEATRQGTHYILNDKSAQNGRTTGAQRAHQKKSPYILSETQTASAPPPPPQPGCIDDLTFLGRTVEEKLDEFVKAWVADSQLPELDNSQ